jgi:hypothetical protein
VLNSFSTAVGWVQSPNAHIGARYVAVSKQNKAAEAISGEILRGLLDICVES